jgi:hypothetical protein
MNIIKNVIVAAKAALLAPSLRPAEMAVLRAVALAVLGVLGYHEVS